MNKSSSSKTTSQTAPKQLKIQKQNPQKSKCTVSRCVCIQLIFLLALVLLAAIIIPVIVIVLANSGSNSCAKTYSDSFTSGVTATTQCTSWRSFTTGLTCTTYSKMRIYGSNDPTGITIADVSTVTALAVALKYNTTLIARYNGINWRVGPDWSGYEITSTGGHTCSTGYTVRPCAGNLHWGGIAGATCSPLSQTLSISFE
ncbi:unnamed protein product [Adineta ricciae]|uniref:Uncharacterized protein n=1 Tax=Adineta ricciae TaxID=249248 RepID=A0A815MS27_ADIRI|nr:unnamed protein product [Adineta ricciae]CAF1422121.1 unnamed protein product [Adineta ricciae]